MNKHFKELASNAGFIEDDEIGDNFHVFDGYEAITCTEELKRFAESIIESCVWQVVKDNQVPQDIQVLICERFKQHFGVKE